MKNKEMIFHIIIIGLVAICMLTRQARAETVVKVADGLSSPVGMVFDRDGFLYIANWSGNRVDRRHPDGKLEPYLMGIPSPSGLAMDGQGRLYVATYSGGSILRFTKDKKREVFLAGLSVVAGLGFDLNGNLLVAERGKSRIISVSPEARVIVLVDQGLRTPVAACQLTETVYVINDITGRVFSYDAEHKQLKTLSEKLKAPAAGLTPDPVSKDAVYTVDYGGTGLYRITLDGETTVVTPQLSSPVGLAIDADGTIYAATWSDNALYKAGRAHATHHRLPTR